MSDTDIQVVSSSWAGIQRVAAIPKPPEFFKGRKGYEPGFFGGDNRVELPSMGDAIDMDDIATLDDGSFELRYQHFSTVWVKQGDAWKMKFQQMTASHWGDW